MIKQDLDHDLMICQKEKVKLQRRIADLESAIIKSKDSLAMSLSSISKTKRLVIDSLTYLQQNPDEEDI